jgi:hypothetical protein
MKSSMIQRQIGVEPEYQIGWTKFSSRGIISQLF